MTRCAIAVGAEMAALHLLPQTAGFASNVPARGRPMGSPLLRSDPFAQSEVLL
jgi:hypothetical protein